MFSASALWDILKLNFEERIKKNYFVSDIVYNHFQVLHLILQLLALLLYIGIEVVILSMFNGLLVLIVKIDTKRVVKIYFLYFINEL